MGSQDLTGAGWELRAVGGPPAVLAAHDDVARWMPAAVPGTTHGQLWAAGRIADPRYDRNELDLQWIDQLDWEFRRTLTATPADCRRARQELIFEGLDTVGTIFLNDKEVGRSVNMFRRVVCDVRGVLIPGANALVVRFGSPTAYGAAQAAAHPEHIVSHAPGLRGNREFVWQTGERRWTHRPWIRKTQCHFGWDWGLCLPTQGLWRPCRLECSDAPRIEALTVSQRHRGPAGTPSAVALTVSVRLAHPRAAAGRVVVTCAGTTQRVPVRLRAGRAIAQARFTIPNPKLWWPNGYGGQPLYPVTARWEAGGETLRRRIGLRTLELITRPDRTPEGRAGASMTFRVNGRDIFAKGANWIPPDPCVERCTPDLYRHLLTSMADAHMNMVRVWGGGWYELETFYDLCDAKGLLVWQDFMMACALFPDTPAFIREVTAEAVDQVRRLQHHACLALWCGDNENLTGVNHWWRHPDDPDAIRQGYTRMMTALRATVRREDPTRRFWVSSPSNGWIDADSESPDKGDVHCWAVWHGRKPFDHYHTVRPRFCSEFGFQSFPEPRTLRACVPPHGLNPSSWHMEHHQRSGEGNALITNTIARELPIPKDFDAYCWASQINQASAIRTAVEHWRRIRPWCAGALYWQANDIWPVASWSSIDGHGRWKALHHAATRFFAPLLVSLVHDPESGTIGVWACSDLARPLALKGTLIAMTWTGRIVGREPLAARLPSDTSREVARIPLAKLLGAHTAPRDVCLFVDLAGGGQRGRNHLALVPWKYVALPQPRLRTALRPSTQGLVLSLTTDCIAPFVHAEIADTESHFVGSFDILRPGERVDWPLVAHRDRGQPPLTLAAARRGLRVFSLYDLAWRDTQA